MADEDEKGAPAGSPEGEVETPLEVAPEPDWKAQAEQREQEVESLRSRYAKLENDLRSAKGDLGQRLDLEAHLNRITRRLDKQDERTAILLKAQVEGDAEGTGQAVAALEAREREELGRDGTQQQAYKLWGFIAGDIETICQLDPKDGRIADQAWERLDRAPELAELKQLFQQGWDSGDLDTVHKAALLSKDLREKAQRQARAAEVETAKKAAREAVEEEWKDKMDAAGVHDTLTPKAAGGGGENWRDLTPTQKIALGLEEEARRKK